MRSLYIALLALLLFLASLTGTVSQESTSNLTSSSGESDIDINGAQVESEQIKSELESLKNEIEISNQRQQEISDEIRSLSRDRDTLNNDLIESAEKIKVLEVSIEQTENRIEALTRQEQEAKDDLASKNDVLTHVLAALQRIGKNPPPALVIQPQDALSAVRSAILLNAVIPEIREESVSIVDDLTNISNLRASIESSSLKLQDDALQINEERVRIETLLEIKKQQIANSETDLNEELQQSLQLAEKAESIEALIAELTNEINAAIRKANEQNQAGTGVASLSDADPNRVEPTIAFSQTKGQLPIPVRGSFVLGFGEENGIGEISEGQYINTSPSALVTSPCDGWVVYAGKFRQYEQLLILNAGNGYHVLLAGMDAIDVQLGQFALAGEPVGRMGITQSSRAINVAFEFENPILYIEFRKDDSPINPDPWWEVANQQEVIR